MRPEEHKGCRAKGTKCCRFTTLAIDGRHLSESPSWAGTGRCRLQLVLLTSWSRWTSKDRPKLPSTDRLPLGVSSVGQDSLHRKANRRRPKRAKPGGGSG